MSCALRTLPHARSAHRIDAPLPSHANLVWRDRRPLRKQSHYSAEQRRRGMQLWAQAAPAQVQTALCRQPCIGLAETHGSSHVESNYKEDLRKSLTIEDGWIEFPCRISQH